MTGTEIELPVVDGVLSGVDFGGHGEGVLLVHGTRRSFMRHGHWWVRRPVIEEVATVTAVEPDAEVFPAVDVYARLTCPMTIVLAEDGFYSARRDEVRAVVDAVPGRRLIDINSNHNAPMTRPADLAAIILDLVRDRAAASVRNVD